MATQTKIRPDAERLGKKIDEAIEEARLRFSQAQTPDPAWAVFSTAEINRRQEERLRSALESNKSNLEAVRQAALAKLEDYRVEAEKTLHPLANSILEREQRLAQYQEELGFRLARSVSMEDLVEEVKEAMKNGSIQLASHLIEWGERFLDTEDVKELQLFYELRDGHLKALGLDILFASRDFVRGELRHLDGRIAMFTASGGKIDVSDANGWAEAEKMLVAFNK